MNDLKLIDGKLFVDRTNIKPISFQESDIALNSLQLKVLTEVDKIPGKMKLDLMKSLQDASDLILRAIDSNTNNITDRFSDKIKQILQNKKSILVYSGASVIMLPKKILSPNIILTPESLRSYLSKQLSMIINYDANDAMTAIQLSQMLVSKFINRESSGMDMDDLITVIYGESIKTKVALLDRRKLIEVLEGFSSTMKQFYSIQSMISEYIRKTSQLLNNSTRDAREICHQIRCYSAVSKTINIFMRVIAKYYLLIINAAEIITHAK